MNLRRSIGAIFLALTLSPGAQALSLDLQGEYSPGYDASLVAQIFINPTATFGDGGDATKVKITTEKDGSLLLKIKNIKKKPTPGYAIDLTAKCDVHAQSVGNEKISLSEEVSEAMSGVNGTTSPVKVLRGLCQNTGNGEFFSFLLNQQDKNSFVVIENTAKKNFGIILLQ